MASGTLSVTGGDIIPKSPYATLLALINGATTTEQSATLIIDYGVFLIVTLTAVSVPSATYFAQLPAFARTRISQSASDNTVVYIDANTRELKVNMATSDPIYMTLIIPVGAKRY